MAVEGALRRQTQASGAVRYAAQSRGNQVADLQQQAERASAGYKTGSGARRRGGVPGERSRHEQERTGSRNAGGDAGKKTSRKPARQSTLPAKLAPRLTDQLAASTRREAQLLAERSQGREGHRAKAAAPPRGPLAPLAFFMRNQM